MSLRPCRDDGTNARVQFFETLELQNFPWDCQDLTFALALNILDTNPHLGCQLIKSKDFKGHIPDQGFYLPHLWTQENYKKKRGKPRKKETAVKCSVHNMGVEGRRFPTVYFSIL